MREAKRIEEAMRVVTDRISRRVLRPGDRLPSIRKFASTLKMSPSTVVEAYARLSAEGKIKARPGSGYYVSKTIAPLVLADAGLPVEREIDPLWVSRTSLGAAESFLKPGCGWMPTDWMPNDIVAKALRSVARSDPNILSDYSDARGSFALRHLLSQRFSDEGLTIYPDNIMLSVSGTQAIDLVCRFMLQPGDTVLIDDPCYFNFQALLRVHQVKVVGVPYNPEGPDVIAFSKALVEHMPRLYITNSGLHNPTGATISPQVAHRILSLSAQHDLTIVEDEIFAPLEPESSPRLATLDGLERVVRIGSFSKAVSASVRCGYVAAKSEWIECLIDLQVATNFGGAGSYAAETIRSVLLDSAFRRHLDALRLRLEREREEVVQKLTTIGIKPWVMPRGGFYLWCRLPAGCSATELTKLSLKEGIVLAPGNVFSPSRTMDAFMRFNVSQMQDPKIFDRLSVLINQA